MSKTLQLIVLLGLLIVATIPAQAWWGRGGNAGYYAPGFAPGYYYRNNVTGNDGYRNAPVEDGNVGDENRSIWSDNNPWKNWRAPWSNDRSRWGNGPWDSFGGAMNNFVSEMEGDLDLKMKIRGEGQGKEKSHQGYRGYGYNGYSRRFYPRYYGYPVRPQYRVSPRWQ